MRRRRRTGQNGRRRAPRLVTLRTFWRGIELERTFTESATPRAGSRRPVPVTLEASLSERGESS
jgi:hypothetical protein